MRAGAYEHTHLHTSVVEALKREAEIGDRIPDKGVRRLRSSGSFSFRVPLHLNRKSFGNSSILFSSVALFTIRGFVGFAWVSRDGRRTDCRRNALASALRPRDRKELKERILMIGQVNAGEQFYSPSVSVSHYHSKTNKLCLFSAGRMLIARYREICRATF